MWAADLKEMAPARAAHRGHLVYPFLSWKPQVGCGVRRLSGHISLAGAVRFYILAIFVVDKWPGKKTASA
jgi:hypothetical protein